MRSVIPKRPPAATPQAFGLFVGVRERVVAVHVQSQAVGRVDLDQQVGTRPLSAPSKAWTSLPQIPFTPTLNISFAHPRWPRIDFAWLMSGLSAKNPFAPPTITSKPESPNVYDAVTPM